MTLTITDAILEEMGRRLFPERCVWVQNCQCLAGPSDCACRIWHCAACGELYTEVLA